MAKNNPKSKELSTLRRMLLLRYLLVALLTGLLQYVTLKLPLSGYGNLFPLLLRMSAMFILLKIWVYKEQGVNRYDLARQVMLAIMLLTAITLIIQFLILYAGIMLGRPLLCKWIGQGVMELLYFVVFHFIIFKDSKNG